MILLNSFILLLLSFGLIFIRILRTKDWTTRLLGFDLLQTLLACCLLILKTISGWAWNRDAVWMIVLISFITTWMLISFLSVKKRKDH